MSTPPAPSNPARRRFLKAALGAGVGLTAFGAAGYAQGHGLGVTRHTRTLPGLKRSVTVAFLTDLHYGLYIGPADVKRWVETTNILRPDLIVLGGDQLDRHMRGIDTPPAELLAELKRLRAPLGVYGVWGNHDYGVFGEYTGHRHGPPLLNWPQTRTRFRQAFADAGVRVLRNEGLPLRDDLYLGGVDDLWHGRPDVRTTLAGAGQRATLLLSHNPDLLPDLPQPAGLVLCGHTHGGQVRFPLVGAIPFAVPSDYGTRYAMGWVTGAHDTPAYVSRGLGMSGIPFRNLCDPEIALLTLLPAQG